MVLLDEIGVQLMFLVVAAHQLPQLWRPRRRTGVSNRVQSNPQKEPASILNGNFELQIQVPRFKAHFNALVLSSEARPHPEDDLRRSFRPLAADENWFSAV